MGSVCSMFTGRKWASNEKETKKTKEPADTAAL